MLLFPFHLCAPDSATPFHLPNSRSRHPSCPRRKPRIWRPFHPKLPLQSLWKLTQNRSIHRTSKNDVFFERNHDYKAPFFEPKTGGDGRTDERTYGRTFEKMWLFLTFSSMLVSSFCGDFEASSQPPQRIFWLRQKTRYAHYILFIFDHFYGP